MRISDWSSDVCSSDLILVSRPQPQQGPCRNLLGGNRIGQQAFHARWFNARGLPEGNCRVVRGRISVPGRDGTGAWDRLGTTALVWEAVVFHFRHPGIRSEEHTSELQSLMRISYAVFCLKKKKTDTQ